MQSAKDFILQTFLAAPTWDAALGYSTLIVGMALGGLVIPGKTVLGQQFHKGTAPLPYKINGFKMFLLTVLIFTGLSFSGIINGQFFAENYWPTFTFAMIFAVAHSVFLFVKASLQPKQPYDQVQGGIINQFTMGKELNPRLWGFDFKFFAYRPAMTFWIIINLSHGFLQYKLFSTLTLQMLVYQGLCFMYVFDYFWNEQKMLTTWDIIAQNFGYMLVFGDYVFIPFTFCITSRYLYADGLDNVLISIVSLVIGVAGFIIFRLSNSEKHRFKTNRKQFEDAVVIGGLLASGWWGRSRHINYFGDLLLSIGMCLTAVGLGLMPFFYTIYLHILLAQRAYRDQLKCQKKYGTYWSLYCQKVPYMIAPFRGDVLYRMLGKGLSPSGLKDD